MTKDWEYVGSLGYLQRQNDFVADLLKAAPDLRRYFTLDIPAEIEGHNGLGVMEELTRISARLTESEDGALHLTRLFNFFEESLARHDEVVDHMIFCVSEDPTGKSPDMRKLLPWMGPRLKASMGIS